MEKLNGFFSELAGKMKLPKFFEGSTLILNNLFLTIVLLVLVIALVLVIVLVPNKKKKSKGEALEVEGGEELVKEDDATPAQKGEEKDWEIK